MRPPSKMSGALLRYATPSAGISCAEDRSARAPNGGAVWRERGLPGRLRVQIVFDLIEFKCENANFT